MNISKTACMLCFVMTALAVFTTTTSLHSQALDERGGLLYTAEQGLSNNNVTGIVQDSAGYLWISTAFGLNRFNGLEFVQCHSTDEKNSLPAENISGLSWLDGHRLVAYGDGMHITDMRSGKSFNLFIPYHDKRFQYKFNFITAVSSNSAGDIFVLARSGFYHFDSNCHLLFRYDHYTTTEVANTPFVFGQYLFPVDDNRFIIISSAGLRLYNANEKKLHDIGQSLPALTTMQNYPSSRRDFFQLRKGCLISFKEGIDSVVCIDVLRNRQTTYPLPISASEFDYHSSISAFNDSVACISSKTGGLYEITCSPSTGAISFNPKKYFPSYQCHAMLRDRGGNLWLGTGAGLLRQQHEGQSAQQLAIPASLTAQFPDMVIDDIEVSDKNLYVATRGRGGILMFDKLTQRFIKQIGFQQYSRHPAEVLCLVNTPGNRLLAGTNGPLFIIDSNAIGSSPVHLDNWSPATGWISDLYKDAKNKVWIVAGNIYCADEKLSTIKMISDPGKMLDKIEWPQRITADAEGNMWIAGHGLIRYNVKENKFDRILDSFPCIKMPDRQVNSFIADKHGRLWINPNNNGLVCYDCASKTYQHFTVKNGLPANNIASMIILDNKLWLATFSGIACLDLETLHIVSFCSSDGFPEQPISIGAKFCYDSAAHNLYIGFSKVIARFNPEQLLKKTSAPKLFIESIRTAGDEQRILPGKDFSIPWDKGHVNVVIGTLDYITGKSQRFCYRILRQDSSAWQELGARNSFNISNLQPGDHRIQVKMFSNGNRWPEQLLEMKLRVLPPFWMRTWFLLVLAVLLLLIAYGLVKWRTSSIRRKERAKTHMARLKAEEYKTRFELEQISHHFSTSITADTQVEDILWDLTGKLIGSMDYQHCMIYLWNKDKTCMVQKASFGVKDSPGVNDMQLSDVRAGEGVVGYVMETCEPVIIPDTRQDYRYRVDDIRRLSEICVPIIQDGQLIGIIDSEHAEVNHFTERDIKILTTIATLTSNKIKQVEYEQSMVVQQKKINVINQQLAEAQLSALQTQMNPHFIFNSLNSIKLMILENEQQKASRYMSKFANLLRITLSQSRQVFTTLNENMEHLENYLAMEKLRFDDSFTFRITADEELDREDTLIPTMMIQPLAENAIWHGLMPKKGKKRLVIHFSKLDERIQCIIEDNGIGMKQSAEQKKLSRPLHRSVGLSNLQNRIQILNEKFSTDCILEITDMLDLPVARTGSRATLTFNQLTEITSL